VTPPLVAAARAYLGTPFLHRGRTPVGLDCAGLVWRAYADLGVLLPDVRIYGREPYRNGLEAAMVRALGEPVARHPAAGDVLLIRFDREPHHIGIAADYPHGGLSLLHAHGMAGCVVEHRLNKTWRDRIVAVFRREPT
jgi:cell wall-associated NlpC family hydrolase